MADQVLISVFIIGSRGSEGVERALKSVEAQTMDAVLYETRVIDSLEAGREAMSCASGKIVVFLDDRMVLDRRAFERMYDAFCKFPAAAGLAGKILPIWGDRRPAWMGFGAERLYSLINFRWVCYRLPPGMFYRCFIVLNRDVFIKGGWSVDDAFLQSHIESSGRYIVYMSDMYIFSQFWTLEPDLSLQIAPDQGHCFVG